MAATRCGTGHVKRAAAAAPTPGEARRTTGGRPGPLRPRSSTRQGGSDHHVKRPAARRPRPPRGGMGGGATHARRDRRRITRRRTAARHVADLVKGAAAGRRPRPQQEEPPRRRGRGGRPGSSRFKMGRVSWRTARRGAHHAVRPRVGNRLNRRRAPPSSHLDLLGCGASGGPKSFNFTILMILFRCLTAVVTFQASTLQENMANNKVHYKVRRHLQPDTIIRDGVPDSLVFVTVKEHCKTIQVVDSFTRLGEPAPAPGDPPQMLHHMMVDAAQTVTRAMITIQRDLFDLGLCLTQIASDTFLVEATSGKVYLSKRAYTQDMVPMNKSQEKQCVDKIMDCLSEIIVRDVIGSNPIPIEVAQGLIPLMKRQGFDMLHVIQNHPSLVPIGTRLDLNLRMHDHLRNALFAQNIKMYNQVLKNFQFPKNWHSMVNSKSNPHMAKFYNGSTYSPAPVKNLAQEAQVLRYNRNSSEHGMQYAVDPSTLLMQFERPDIARLLYTVFPLLVELAMEDLFLYKSNN